MNSAAEQTMADTPRVVSAAGTDITLRGDEHVRVYRATGGELGYIWNGVTTLLMTFTGRKSELKSTIPIIFTQVGNACVIIASKGGSPEHPQWYLNLLANPDVEVQIKDRVFNAGARAAPSPLQCLSVAH